MLRNLCSFCFFVLLVLFCTDAVWAQANTWPAYPLGGEGEHAIDRGPGGYFSWIKLLAIFLVYLLWVKTTDWVNQDCQKLDLPYAVWNLVVYVPFLIGFVLALSIPLFVAGYSVFALSYLVPLGVYIFQRNSIVDPHERVMTPSHIRYLAARQASKSGFEVRDEKQAAHEKGAPVVFTAKGGIEQQNQANMIAARQSPGFIPAKELLAEIVRQRGDKCMLDYTRDAVNMRYQIDGVWHEGEGQDRESGDEMLVVFKKLGNLNVDERRKRQSGQFVAEYDGVVYQCAILSQGTQTGERVILQVDRPRTDFKSLSELGMREKMQQKLQELLSKDEGMVLVSSPPANGLSTSMLHVLGLTDRYMRDFIGFQSVDAPESLAENIELTTYDVSKGETPQKVLETAMRREPNGLVASDLPNEETAKMFCQYARKDRLIITSVRAKEAVEALLRVLVMKVPAADFAPAITAVLNQRLIRRLCDECKQGYEPGPQLLKKLGIPAGRVEHLFRPPDPNEEDKVCPKCNGIGYYGRIAIFELLVVDTEIRDALMKQPKLDVLRKVSRKSGNRNLQQEGIVLVAQGITSVQELSRALKQ